jgi:ubiquinone/menaquinone biosynthesis C-methylase UbiE
MGIARRVPDVQSDAKHLTFIASMRPPESFDRTSRNGRATRTTDGATGVLLRPPPTPNPEAGLCVRRARIVLVADYDQLADQYDATRGGEQRGDEYAADLDARLPQGEGPILEIGVGTGVVALGLTRRGRDVIGLDVSAPMLARAHERLGQRVVLSDARKMSITSASIAHAVSVWVVQSVGDPVELFKETARVLRPGGHYVVCSTQRPALDDPVGQIMTEMGARVDVARGAARPRGVSANEVLEWAGRAGFMGTIENLERQWYSSPSEELASITHRIWPALRELDDDAVEEVTRPAIRALQALPHGQSLRTATADVIDLVRP